MTSIVVILNRLLGRGNVTKNNTPDNLFTIYIP